ncbi:ABC transporter ATP-binding protein [Peribacillus asahii]|uniref:ABC transporter ATP-binding protein n=1 Tax=Peribacillus asahii TaxID=228899 RepID=UPI00207937D0|nr:ABC transporter ATP-binding protein [Peribacillus asahii]USK70560.1 ABC transporter ATP-binding protein/permease [Peribacillus asahii]
MTSLQKLLVYIKPYKWFAILGPLFMCLEVAMDLLQPTMMQHMIDTGIANGDHAYVIKLGIFMLISAVFGLIGGMGSAIYSTKAAVYFGADIRRDVFHKTEQFSSRNHDRFGTGKLITIVTNDITTVQNAIRMTLFILVRGPFLFIGSIVIVWITARELFPVLLIAIPVLTICIVWFSAKSGQLFQKVQEAMDKVNTKLQETLAGIRVVKAFNREEFEKNNFKMVNDTLTKRNFFAEQMIVSLMPITMFVVNLAIVAGMWLGAIQVNQGVIQIGMILAFINYLHIIMNGLMSMTHVLMQITRSFPSADRITQVLEMPIDIQNPEEPAPVSEIRGEVEFCNVHYSYSKNGEYVLKNISFHAKPGQKIGIIGSTGSGKTTLLKLLPRLYDPDSGTILIDGIDLRNHSLETLRSAIGFVPQKATLFSGTIEENMRYGKEHVTALEMEKAAELAAASEFIHKLDGTYDYTLMQGATNLSGGQKQRLSIARALIRKPNILLLDDSTSALDAKSEAAVQQALKKEFPDTTVFLIGSKISSIIDCDQILVLEDGMIEASGTHDELLMKSLVYREIYRTQSGKEVLNYE